MIKKVDTLPSIPVSSMSLAKIYAQKRAFSDSPLENNFWVQTDDSDKITAVISEDIGSMNLYCDGADYGELYDFLSVVRPSVIFTEYENALPLKIKCERVRNMLTVKSIKTESLVEDFTLQQLYDGLENGSDVDIHLPPFEVFAPDVSHRLRHGGAVAVTREYGAALAFLYDGGGVMSGIALSPEFRGKGLGKSLLRELLANIDGDFFVAANDVNKNFYLRNGFTLSGSVCFGKME